MIVRARNTRWDNKLKKCGSIADRNSLIANSGPYRCATLWDFKKECEFWRPAIGNFIIHGESETDDFRFDNEKDAIVKGEELYQKLLIEIENDDHSR